MEIKVPGSKKLKIETVVLDLNGTLSVNGQIVKGVKNRLLKLKEKGLRIVLFSGDTRGTAARVAGVLGLELFRTKNSKEKLAQIEKLGRQTCVTLGNGLIDLLQMRKAALAIVTLQKEGVHVQTLLAADLVVPSINDGLDLLLDEKSLVATLRK